MFYVEIIPFYDTQLNEVLKTPAFLNYGSLILYLQPSEYLSKI